MYIYPVDTILLLMGLLLTFVPRQEPHPFFITEEKIRYTNWVIPIFASRCGV